MKTTRIAQYSLALALSIVVAAQPALACGGYGDFGTLEQRRTNHAMAVVQSYAQAIAQRNTANAVSRWHVSATGSFDHNGCCPPPRWNASQWVSQRLADRTYRIVSVTPLTVTDNGIVTIEAISQGAQGRWSETITVQFLDNEWRIAGLSARNSTSRAK